MDKIERNQFNAQWLDAGRAAGFSDMQLKFLEDYHYHECSTDCML